MTTGQARKKQQNNKRVGSQQKAPSFRRRPESSGLDRPFPQGGHDIKGGIGSAWHGRAETGNPIVPRPALLDSSLRWNDDEEKKSGLPSGNPFAIAAECLTPSPPSFQRSPESPRRHLWTGSPVCSERARPHGFRAFGELSGSAELAEDRAVVERRREQAAEEARNRLAQIGILPRRHSGAGRNPVLDTSHSCGSRNDLRRRPP